MIDLTYTQHVFDLYTPVGSAFVSEKCAHKKNLRYMQFALLQNLMQLYKCIVEF